MSLKESLTNLEAAYAEQDGSPCLWELTPDSESEQPSWVILLR